MPIQYFKIKDAVKEDVFKLQIQHEINSAYLNYTAPKIEKYLNLMARWSWVSFMCYSLSMQSSIVGKPQMQSILAIIILICICIFPAILYIFIIYILKKIRTNPYYQQIAKAEFYVTQGLILEAAVLGNTGRIQLSIEYTDASGQLKTSTFLTYPTQLLYNGSRNAKIKDDLKPIHLPKQQDVSTLLQQHVELCLLPESDTLVQLRLIQTQAKYMQIWQKNFSKAQPVWHQHVAGIMCKDGYLDLSDIRQIHAEKISEQEFILYFHCYKNTSFTLSNQVQNFNELEQTIFKYFKKFNHQNYSSLQQSDDVSKEKITLWQDQRTDLQKQEDNQQLDLSIGLLFIICMVIFFIAVAYLGLYAIIFLILSFVGLYYYYSSTIKNKRLLDPIRYLELPDI